MSSTTSQLRGRGIDQRQLAKEADDLPSIVAAMQPEQRLSPIRQRSSVRKTHFAVKLLTGKRSVPRDLDLIKMRSRTKRVEMRHFSKLLPAKLLGSFQPRVPVA